jgi:hypothetical protein
MSGYTEINLSILQPKLPKDRNELEALRRRNNPAGEPVGNFTGRCAHCGSNDLWDDNLAYGCNFCHALLGGN